MAHHWADCSDHWRLLLTLRQNRYGQEALMTRRSYQLKAEQARNERWQTIQIRLTPEEYEAFRLAAAKHDQTPSGFARLQIRNAIRRP